MTADVGTMWGHICSKFEILPWAVQLWPKKDVFSSHPYFVAFTDYSLSACQEFLFPICRIWWSPSESPWLWSIFPLKGTNLPLLVYSGEWIHAAHFNLQAEMLGSSSASLGFFPTRKCMEEAWGEESLIWSMNRSASLSSGDAEHHTKHLSFCPCCWPGETETWNGRVRFPILKVPLGVPIVVQR